MSATPTINGKPWYTSRTLWFNGVCAMLAVAELNFKLLEGRIPGGFYTWMAFVLPIGNALLRIITTTALTLPKVDQPAPPAQGGFLSFELVAVILFVAATLYGFFQAGQSFNENKWLKKEAAQQQADRAERERGAKLARAAAEYAIAEEQRAAERNAHLEGVMNDARKQFPLLAQPARVAGVAAHAGACAAGPVRHGADTPSEPAQSAAPPPLALVPWPVPVDPGLTLGAIWLWNAALTGQASAPAGACRIDEAARQADPACAEPSGLTIDDAWDNHKANARACAEDRARHQRLIDFLNQVPPTTLSK